MLLCCFRSKGSWVMKWAISLFIVNIHIVLQEVSPVMNWTAVTVPDDIVFKFSIRYLAIQASANIDVPVKSSSLSEPLSWSIPTRGPRTRCVVDRTPMDGHCYRYWLEKSVVNFFVQSTHCLYRSYFDKSRNLRFWLIEGANACWTGWWFAR